MRKPKKPKIATKPIGPGSRGAPINTGKAMPYPRPSMPMAPSAGVPGLGMKSGGRVKRPC